jgi:hypothetical protein
MAISISDMDNSLLILGFGYSARAFVERHSDRFARITATSRRRHARAAGDGRSAFARAREGG